MKDFANDKTKGPDLGVRGKRGISAIYLFTIFYLLFFAVWGIMAGNYEFLYYETIILLIFFGLTSLNQKSFTLSRSITLGLSLLGLFHLAGGNVYLGTSRLYDIWIVDGLLKFDNVVHALAIFIVTVAIYEILDPHLDKKMREYRSVILSAIVLIAVGVGAMSEIVELGAVTLFDVGDKVGDYLNNAIDLVYNFIGAFLAAMFVLKSRMLDN